MAQIKEIPISEIEYPELDFSGDEAKKRMENLKSSIKDKGLLHPITVYYALIPITDSIQVPEPKYGIITGRQRIHACKDLGHKTIKALIYDNVDTEGARTEIHLHENLSRFNLPWYEQIELERQLHELRQKVKGKGQHGKKIGWSLRDTAEELGVSFGSLSEDIRMAEAIIADPRLRKIEDKATAKRIILQNLKVATAESEAGAEPKIEYNTVLCGDSSEILKYYPSNTFDVCITDPPWSRYYRDDNLISDSSTLPVFAELYRVMKWDSFIYIVTSTTDFYMYQTELPKMGYKTQEMPLIWIKEGHLTLGKRNWEYSRNHEPILLAVKGAPALSSSMLSGIFSFPIVPPQHRIHPNEKPESLIKAILEHSSYLGSLVIDPFGGSGIVALTAKNLGRRYVIIERDKKYYEGIVKRLEKNDILPKMS